MATIAINFDTVEKTMSCTMDGEAVANVVGCYVHSGYKDGEYSCELMQYEKSPDGDYAKMTRIVASDTRRGKELAAAGAKSSSLPGFLVDDTADKEKLHAEMRAYWPDRFPKN